MRTVTFPTAFASTCYVVQSNMQSTDNDSAEGHERNPTDVTRTSFKVYYNTPVSYIAVGKQQWGVITSNLPKDSNVVITYPVAFTTFASGVSQSIGVSSAWNFVQNDCSLTDITVQSQGAVRSKCWWIAIGK